MANITCSSSQTARRSHFVVAKDFCPDSQSHAQHAVCARKLLQRAEDYLLDSVNDLILLAFYFNEVYARGFVWNETKQTRIKLSSDLMEKFSTRSTKSISTCSRYGYWFECQFERRNHFLAGRTLPKNDDSWNWALLYFKRRVPLSLTDLTIS